jgi:hypothetical protein
MRVPRKKLNTPCFLLCPMQCEKEVNDKAGCLEVPMYVLHSKDDPWNPLKASASHRNILPQPLCSCLSPSVVARSQHKLQLIAL